MFLPSFFWKKPFPSPRLLVPEAEGSMDLPLSLSLAPLCFLFDSIAPFNNHPLEIFPIHAIPPDFKATFYAPRHPLSLRATLTVDSPPAADASGSGIPKVLLEVRNLRAVIAESKQEILRGVNLTINEGEVHAIMGKNGSGKSTFSKVLVGHPDYEETEGRVVFKGQNLLELDPEERSHAGLFMSFQTTIEIPGVSNMDFLLMAANAKRKKHRQPELSPLEFFGYLNPKLTAVNMDSKFLNRNVNEGFSGGEKNACGFRGRFGYFR